MISIIALDLNIFNGKDLKIFESLKSFHEALKFPETVQSIFYMIIYFVAAYVIGQFLGVASSYLIEKFYYVKKFGYPGECLDQGRSPENYDSECCLVKVALFPISIFCFFVIKIFFFESKKYFSCMFQGDDGFILERLKLIMRSYPYKNQSSRDRKKFRAGWKENQQYSFLITYHYVMETECPHLIKISNCISMYGFFRNICFSFIVCSWISMVLMASHFFKTRGIPPGLSVTFCFLGFSILSFVGFDKFYKRFAKEVLYAALVNQDQQLPISKNRRNPSRKIEIL